MFLIFIVVSSKSLLIIFNAVSSRLVHVVFFMLIVFYVGMKEWTFGIHCLFLSSAHGNPSA